MADALPADLPADDALVRDLLRRQVPTLAERGLLAVGESGSSNRMWRLGDDLAVRLPRQRAGSERIRAEARWGPALGARMPVATPQVVHLGEPETTFGAWWSVVTWVPGRRPRTGGGEVDGSDLAALVAALRDAPVPDDAGADPSLRSYRAGPLADLDETCHEALEECRALPEDRTGGLDLDALARVWDAAVRADRAAPRAAVTWVHADLLAENLLVHDGRLAGLIDLGDLAVGDGAVDLIGAWEVLDGTGRRAFREALGLDDATWLRGAGWSVLVLAITLPFYGATMAQRCADRVVAAHAVLDELG